MEQGLVMKAIHVDANFVKNQTTKGIEKPEQEERIRNDRNNH